MEVMGRVIPRRGILVQKENQGQHGRKSVGLLGTNILKEIPEWQQWILNAKNTSTNTNHLEGLVKVTSRVSIPAWSAAYVPVSGPAGKAQRLVEPLNHPLPSNLVLEPVMVGPDEKTFSVKLFNLTNTDVWLNPRTVVGKLSAVELTEKHGDTREVEFSLTANRVEVRVGSHHKVQSSEIRASESTEWIDKIHLPDQLESSHRQKLMDVLNRRHNAFAKHEDDLGRTTTLKHAIHTTDNIPVKQPYRKIPPTQLEEVKEHIAGLVRKGVIRESQSAYASPIVLCRKKNGDLRLCVDYRSLNRKTLKDSFPLPRIEDAMDSLHGAKFFSSMDLKSAYNQVEIQEEDKHKTAFVAAFGHWEYNNMAFGLCNSPATFQHLMQIVYCKETNRMLLVFLDDVVVFSKTVEENLERLDIALQRLEEHGLKVEPSKCHFLQSEVAYCGYRISGEGISSDPEKVSAISQWPVPTSHSELSTFLGTVGYHRRHIRGFAQLASPLYELVNENPNKDKKLKKKGRKSKIKENVVRRPWHWETEHQSAFDNLKESLRSAPVLGYADFTQPFILETDASHKGLGAVLLQDQQGERKVISYASRGFRGPERLARHEVGYH